MTLQDVAPPKKPANTSIPVKGRAFRFSDAGAARALVAERPEVIFHLAAIVSGPRRSRVRQGLPHQPDGTRHLIDAIRNVGGGYSRGWCSRPRSRCSARRFPKRSANEFFHTPLTSYARRKRSAKS